MGTSLQLRPREAFTVFKAASSRPMQANRRGLHIRAGVLTATGQRFQARDVVVKGPMGEGSYGQVFEVSILDGPIWHQSPCCNSRKPLGAARSSSFYIWRRRSPADLLSSPTQPDLDLDRLLMVLLWLTCAGDMWERGRCQHLAARRSMLC